jgi:hypothetical protein
MSAASPEAHFVTLCVREPGSNARESLRSASRSICDWQRVAELAIRHRVAGYVLRSATAAGVEMPSPTAQKLRAEMFTSQAVVMLLEAELQGVVATLMAANVPVLVLKGPGLARSIYPDRTLRIYADLDLMVRKREEERAVAALIGRGYTELLYEAEASRRIHAGHVHDSGTFHRLFAGADNRALIELHLDPLQLGLAPMLEAGRWARAVAVPGLPGALMLGPEDQVVQLSVHQHKHGFSRLIWLKDVDLLLRAHSDTLDWELIHEVCRREGVGSSVWYTLRLVQVLLGTSLPSAVSRLRPSHVTRWLYDLVWPPARVANLEGFMRRRAVQFHGADSWRGMLPSLVLMGRRSTRARMLASVLLHR